MPIAESRVFPTKVTLGVAAGGRYGLSKQATLGSYLRSISENMLTGRRQKVHEEPHVSPQEGSMSAEIRAIEDGAPKGRDKRRKFVELAEKRTVNAIRAIRVIGKLGNKAHYHYDEKDVKKIVSTLSREVEALKTRMTTRAGQEVIEFRL
jgi:hypothetical protein